MNTARETAGPNPSAIEEAPVEELRALAEETLREVLEPNNTQGPDQAGAVQNNVREPPQHEPRVAGAVAALCSAKTLSLPELKTILHKFHQVESMRVVRKAAKEVLRSFEPSHQLPWYGYSVSWVYYWIESLDRFYVDVQQHFTETERNFICALFPDGIGGEN